MDPYDYDPTRKASDTTKNTENVGPAVAGTVGAGVGIVVLVVAIAVAFLAWFWFNDKTDTPSSVARDMGTAAGSVFGAAKDVAKEIPQAASDAATRGDQPTTRPNADGSTKKLDQK